MESTIKERTIEFVKYKGLTMKSFELMCGLSTGYVTSMRKGFGTDKLNNVLNAFPELNREWLLYGEGEMLKSSTPIIRESDESGIPFYKDMPVSAGAADLQLMDGNERQAGFIQIAGIKGKYAFPVVGCSMEPVIHPGDIIVVDPMDRYETIDPDKIYMIITDTDRMIKHIEMDENDNEKLWCVSPNYKRFAIQKADVKGIYRITFYGRLA